MWPRQLSIKGLLLLSFWGGLKDDRTHESKCVQTGLLERANKNVMIWVTALRVSQPRIISQPASFSVRTRRKGRDLLTTALAFTGDIITAGSFPTRRLKKKNHLTLFVWDSERPLLFFFSPQSSSTVKLAHSRFAIKQHSQSNRKCLSGSLYLKGDDETQSDGEELPVEE